jgi:hypothetical protein
METAERTSLIEHLQSGREAILAEASGLSAAQATFTPADGAWSIADCIEHLAVVEKGFLTYMIRSSAPAEGTVTPRTEAEFRREMVDRARRMQSPPPARPTGRYGSLDAALDRFRAHRDETIAYVNNSSEDFRARCITHPIFGTLDGREGILFLAGHALRHLEQIREIKAAPGYPAF